MTKQDLTSKAKLLAQDYGLSKSHARFVAKSFAEECKGLKPKPAPNILIQHVGNDVVNIYLETQSLEKATRHFERFQETQNLRGTWEFQNATSAPERKQSHKFTWEKKEPQRSKETTPPEPKSKTINERFAEMSDEEQKKQIKKWIKQFE